MFRFPGDCYGCHRLRIASSEKFLENVKLQSGPFCKNSKLLKEPIRKMTPGWRYCKGFFPMK
jgi:hypothetical protein